MDPAALAVVAVLVVLVGGVTVWLYGAYSALVVLRRLVEATWEQLDDELRRRHDLVPNLVARLRLRGAVERAAGEVDAVVRALAAARAPGDSVADRVAAEHALSQGLEDLFAVVDGHPGVRADESYLALRRELADIQGRATAARRHYNDNVALLEERRQGAAGWLVERLAGVRACEPAGRIGASAGAEGR